MKRFTLSLTLPLKGEGIKRISALRLRSGQVCKSVRGELVEPRHRRVAFGDMNGPSVNSGQEEYVIIDTKRVAWSIRKYLKD